MNTNNTQGLHEGTRYLLHHPDGRLEALSAKEYLACRAAFNAEHPLATIPSPGAGARRVINPSGAPILRTPKAQP